MHVNGSYPGAAEAATPTRSDLLRAALEYAARGWPVFPCKPGGKRPLTERGHLDATTDPSKITAWWNRWPNANIGIPTGERTGLLVLDVDHPAGLDALEAERGALPSTRTHSTGSGGMHHLYRYPAGEEVRNSAGKLAAGLDVRGEGGYVIAPPSSTTRPYEVLDDLPLAEPPAGLLEALRRKPEPRSVDPGGRAGLSDVSSDVEGPPIPDGQRDDTLFHIGCRLRGEGHDEPAILDALDRVNRARCTPPLPDEQVRVKARQAARYPKGTTTPKASAETLDRLDAVERRHLWGQTWKGNGWKTPRSTLAVLIWEARKHGRETEDGVEVSMGVRSIALAVGANKNTIVRTNGALDKLKDAGVIRQGKRGAGRRAGTFVLLAPPSVARCDHSTTEGARPVSGRTLPRPPTGPRLRYSKGVYARLDGVSYRVGTVLRLGKSAEAVVDILEREGGWMSVPDLGAALGLKSHRDLRRRALACLESSAVVEWEGDNVRLCPDWLAALDRRRTDDQEIADHERDRKRYAEERKNYRDKLEARKLWRVGLDVAEIAAELDIGSEDVRRLLDLRRGVLEVVPDSVEADGLISELEPEGDAITEEVDVDILIALETYLDIHPHRRREAPSWLANTLWCNDLVEGRPTPDEVSAALAMLPERRAA
jgi:hypothetical protein